MKIIKTLKFLIKAEHEHFLSVEYKEYIRWKYIIKLTMLFNTNYKSCEIYRKKYKHIRNLVIIGLKYSGKNVKRRTSGYAKEFISRHRNATCLYCGKLLNDENATADHIVPISKGGNNTKVNMIVCCQSCNLERGNQDFKKYLSLKNKQYKNIKFI